jgi:hypothetical protein
MKRLIVLPVIIAVAVIATSVVQLAGHAILIPDTVVEEFMKRLRVPVTISGDSVYVAWWSNKTSNSNNDVMFRASTDGGQTFGEKINLSNSTDSNSTRVEMDSDEDSVVVTWWETNETDDTPVMRVSNDNGTTFGPILKLATNGSISGDGGGIGNG